MIVGGSRGTTLAVTMHRAHGSPALPSGLSEPKVATSSAGKVAGIKGVQIGPGATAFTRILSSASCPASERVKETIAPLVAE